MHQRRASLRRRSAGFSARAHSSPLAGGPLGLGEPGMEFALIFSDG